MLDCSQRDHFRPHSFFLSKDNLCLLLTLLLCCWILTLRLLGCTSVFATIRTHLNATSSLFLDYYFSASDLCVDSFDMAPPVLNDDFI